MRRKQLLFSKRDKAEKATTMGEEAENQGGNLGLPNNNSKQENNQNKNNNDQKQNNENKNQNQIESITNEVGYEPKPKKSKKALEQELMELQKKLEEERNFSITETNRLNEEDNKKNIELKKLTTTYNNLIQALKAYDQSLIIRTRKISKYKQKSEEEIKKDIKVAESQIKDYEKRVNYNKENYQIFKQQVEKEMNKENDLKNDLNILKEDITSHNEEIKFLKLTSNNHLFCNNENRKLKERLANLITAYEYEIKRAKQLELIDLDKKEEDDLEIKEEYDKIDDKAKAEEDLKNLLPRINILRFKGENMQKLEMKIIKRNERYNNEKKKKKIVPIKFSELKIQDSYLFNEKEEKIMEKVLPENMYNSCKLKFNDILLQKKEIEEQLKTDSNNIKNENESIANMCEYNKMELKTQKLDNLKLVLKSQKLRDKINRLKQDIKDMKEKINKEKKKINEEDKINKYYKNINANKKELQEK